jgi:hypothetical protein
MSSSTKVPIPTVADALKKCSAGPEMIRAVIEELQLRTQGDDDEKSPAIKKQFVILVSDPDGRLPKHDFVGWVLQIPENESVATTQDRIFRGAYDFNASKKGRLLPVRSVGEAIENVPSRFFKESELWVKTKVPVLVLRTDNAIPKEDRSAGDLKDERAIQTNDIIACRIDGDEKTEVYRRDGKVVIEITNGDFRSKSTYDTEAEAMEAFNQSEAA